MILFTLPLFSQIPAGYYNDAAGLSGDPLKNALHTIIDGQIEFPYSSDSTDVWDILKEADRDPNNPNNVIGIYSGFSMNAALEYDGGNGWNKEHVWAKSRGDFGTAPGPGTDVHHLRAADVTTNSARSNRNFDNCSEPYVDSGGNYSGATPSFTSSTDWVWQPRAAIKGDIARMIFYMVVRYEGSNGEPDLELTDTNLSNGDKSPLHARMTTLLQWHNDDPVDDAERTRNDVVYSYQQNRNPFIDHPEYACEIWACGSSSNNAPVFTSSPVTTATEGQAYTYNVTTSDADGNSLTISASTKPSWLSFTLTGNGTATLNGNTGASQVGSHSVVLEVSDGIAAPISQSFTITVSAVGGGSGATELFFSEYIEGSSLNKGLEIANFTGTSVNLSSYSILKQTNGSGAWGSELPLSGTLATGDVFVVVNSGATSAMQAAADLSTGGGALSFNGNDPVALFKNGTLIDVIGDFNSAANYAQNQTLVRKSTISAPVNTYSASEWTVFSVDTFSDLGSHTFDGGTPPPTCDIPTGLSSSSITQSSATISWNLTSAASYSVRYRVTGASVWTDVNNSSNSLSLSGLSSATNYECQVRSQCGATSSSYSASITFSTSAPVNYCTSSGNNGTEEWINRFVLNTIDNNSGMNGGYANFTSMSTSLTTGSNYGFTIYPSWAGTVYNEAYNIWIDYNQDGDFNDSGEAVYSISKNKNNSITGSIAIPSSALLGSTRMRVTLKYNSNASSCETFSYGEVEDYTINISNSSGARKSGATSAINTPTVVVDNTDSELYPNPANDVLVVMVEARDGAHLQLLNISGKIMIDRNYTNSEEVRIDVSAFEKGIYILSIENGGGKITKRVIVN